VHFPATLACLVWLYLRHPVHYLWVRRSMVTLTAVALVVHVLYPLAPPRMLPGFVDTGAVFGPNVYGDSATNSVANQFAAMPSLHVGWALLVAIGLVSAGTSRWRYLWFAHPILTVLVVVATANHYWIDGLVAGGILAATLGVGIGVPVAATSRRREATASPSSA
jgi:PAP2 superfamily